MKKFFYQFRNLILCSLKLSVSDIELARYKRLFLGGYIGEKTYERMVKKNKKTRVR